MLLIAISSSSFIFIIVEKVKNTSFAGEAGWTWRLDFFYFSSSVAMGNSTALV
jgi:hypothetical protein